MLDVLAMHTADLGSTKSYGKRRCCWIPASKDHPEYDGRDGNLTLVMQPARTGWGRKIETDTYFVEEQIPPPHPGRVFLLLNKTDPEVTEPYEVVIGPVTRCSCKGGKCKTETDKHVDAMAYLIANELI